MTESIYLTWRDIESRCSQIATEIRHQPGPLPETVYGIPRGGCVPAAIIAERLDASLVDHPNQADLIVDDLVDSGATYTRVTEHHKGRFVALYAKPWSPDWLVGRTAERVDGWIVFPWEAGEQGGPSDAVVRLLEWIGEDPNRDGLKATPDRVVRAMAEMTAGYRDDPVAILERTFDERSDELVMVRGVEFVSLCEHHLMPFVGTVTVGYIPTDRVVGLSKLARLVECFARRLQVQERMTTEIAEALMTHLRPLGAGVVVTARHSCMGCRGVRKPSAEMVTSAMLGVLREKPEARAEFLALAG